MASAVDRVNSASPSERDYYVPSRTPQRLNLPFKGRRRAHRLIHSTRIGQEVPTWSTLASILRRAPDGEVIFVWYVRGLDPKCIPLLGTHPPARGVGAVYLSKRPRASDNSPSANTASLPRSLALSCPSGDCRPFCTLNASS